jgi:hypothetical protein
MRRYRNNSKPRLEALEARVMLSVGDSPANVPAQVDWSTVIHTSGTEPPLVEVFFNNQGMRVSGTTGTGSIEIDLSQLPATLVSLQITSFESVTLTGQGTLHDLMVSDVKNLDAGHLTAERLFAYGAERVRIDTAPVEVWLQGAKDADGIPTLGEKTLFSTDHFSTAPDAYIWGFVKSLGLMTTGQVDRQLQIFNASPDQPVLMNFTPDSKPKMAGLAEAKTIEGDFATYFFSNRTEQVQLEKSSVVTARAALVQAVSVQQFLGNPRLQVMLMDGGEASGAKVVPTAVSRPLPDGATSVPRSEVNRGVPADHLSSPARPSLSVTLEIPAGAMAADPAGASTQHAEIGHFAGPEKNVATAVNLEAPATAVNRHAESAVLSALSLALARLTEPFVQTVSDLQGRFVTFGEIASSQLNERLRTEGRPALLVDARSTSAKTKSADEVVVVHV